MGMRFRKSVSLGKGARINFGKSGMSLTVGGRGASTTFSKRGVYSNLSIPGTGISYQTKIAGPSKSSSDSSSSRTASGNAAPPNPERARALEIMQSHTDPKDGLLLRVELTDTGEIIFKFKDTDELITDKAVLREIKKDPGVKSAIETLKSEQQEVWSDMQSSSEEASREFVDIYKLTPQVYSRASILAALEYMQPETYTRQTYQVPQPSAESIHRALVIEAHDNVKAIFGKSKKMDEYIQANWNARVQDFYDQWNRDRLEFERQQDEIEAKENQRFLEEHNQLKSAMNEALQFDDDKILELVENWLSNLTIPADISAQIDCVEGKVFLDLDLPEIEDLPQTTTRQLKSGQVKIVNKTQKQLKQEYATCVLGIAFFLAGNIFNLNPNICEVTISGYTQRRDKQGDLKDDYIYSVRFPRDSFAESKVQDPLTDINAFESRMKLSTAFNFGVIKPYEGPSEE